jgi:AcrR family transcriptional regulator
MGRKPRSYESALRAEGAEQTRERILAAGRKLLIERGYAAMTMQAVADSADVALDTVYASVGKKPALVELLFETAISNTDQAVAAEQREYVQRVRATPRARDKLTIYAGAVVSIQHRLAPLVHAVELAGQAAPELAAIWKAISERRSRNMKLFAADLIATGDTRAELDVDEIADVLWVMNSPQQYLMFVEHRGWSRKQLEAWLADSWIRLFLR